MNRKLINLIMLLPAAFIAIILLLILISRPINDKEVVPDVAFETIKKRDGSWKYSYDFCKEVIPSYYGGSVWIDGNVILFSITTT